MLPKDLQTLLEKWELRENTFKRDVEDDIRPYVGAKNAVFLYGPRRSGKSIVAKRLLASMPSGVKTRYVNLEDPALMGSLNLELLDSFAEGLLAKDVLVLDEVQLVSGWERWVRRAVDTRQCSVIVTGSSAKLLSGEFATSLGGRGIGFQVLPLSFSEFARITGKGLDGYLKSGGYPEVVLEPEKREKLLESYFESALIRDIVARHNVRDTSALRNLAFYLLTNSGKETSLKQIRVAMGLSYDAIRQFIGYLEAAFLIFQVPFFSYSLKKSLTRQRKVYAWDTGMQQYASKSFTEDAGRLAESVVGSELLRRGYETYYWRGKREVDFVARKKAVISPINVCYSKAIPMRELEGLAEFCSEHRLKGGTILSLAGESVKEAGGIEIRNQGIEEWLLKR